MLVFSQEYIFANNAYRYSIAVWNTQSNEFRTRLSSDVMGFTKCIATGTGFLLTANTGNNFYVYELDQNLNVVRSVGHQFASSVYIYFNATQVCDNELLAMCANATGNYLEVIKSEKGWQFLGTSIGCPVLHPTDSVATMVADNGVNYQNSTLNFSGIIPTVNNSDLGIVATVVASNTNCELVDIVQDTLLACNQPNVVLQPTEAFRTCLPTDAVRSYSWSDGASQLDHTVSASGWYKVVINEDVCQDEDSIYVRLEQAAVRITGDARFCAGNGEEARFTANSSSGELTWGPVFSDQKTYETTTEGKVFVQVITPAGCIASDTIFAEEVCEPLVYFPSAFTPDGDGINDHYSASILYATNSDLKIYNRWGELVYETTDSTVNWDGTFRGADSGQGIYVWQLHYTSEVTHEKVMQRGSFNLVR